MKRMRNRHMNKNGENHPPKQLGLIFILDITILLAIISSVLYVIAVIYVYIGQGNNAVH